MRLIIIRHGESEANRLGIHAGHKDFGLSDEGMRQAKLVVNSLKDEKIEAVYSSDLKRAVSTAETIADEHGLNVIIDERLREFDCGEKIANMEGMEKWVWFNEYKRKEAERLGIEPDKVSAPGGESEQYFFDRVRGILNEIIERHKGTVVVVAHGGVNKFVFHLLGCFETLQKSREVKQKNSCINEFEFDGNDWKIIRLNCLKHLE